MKRRLAVIRDIGKRILEDNPSPVVRYRLLRDILGYGDDHPELIAAGQRLNADVHVKELAEVQNEDGGWGRFHTASSTVKSKIPTTETAVNRAVALGLDKSNTVLKKALIYIKKILNGNILFPDPPEKNDRWETGWRLFAASMLSVIEPDAKDIDKYWNLWIEIAERAFASGVYNESNEIQAHCELTGATVGNSYLVIGSKYQLLLLGSRSCNMSVRLQKSLMNWIFNRESGIGYLGQPLNQPPPLRPFSVDAWLTSHEILSNFRYWREFSKSAVDWLWDLRDEVGFWDLGSRAKYMGVHYFPLSENWRRGKSRRHDWSTRIMALLCRYYGR
ncbi:MAG TPA: hypothetical protein ENL22_05385 [candidate division Zixibacteria bacterium]|nr:hypothetical protein [candidate division Zixibacteria bacterium]